MFKDDFVPHSLLRNGHLQTVAASFAKQNFNPKHFQIHLVPLGDGDHCVVEEITAPDQTCEDKSRSVIIFHGLCGSSSSNYMRRIGTRIANNGYRVFLANSRGSGIGARFANGHTHAGRTDDMHRTVSFIKQLSSSSELTLVGFSLSGNVMLGYFGRCRNEIVPEVDSAIVVAPPIDLVACSRHLQNGLGRLYDSYFARQLMRQLKIRRRGNPAMLDRKIDQSVETIVGFDEAFTAPVAGFNTAHDYYDFASSTHYLDSITLPTKLLVAEDDPVVPIKMFERAGLAKSIDLCVTRFGGHLGYVSRSDPALDGNWMDRQIERWIDRIDGQFKLVRGTFESDE